MIPAKFDLELYRGDSYGWQFKFWTDANRTVPFDLAGTTITSQIRDKPSGSKIIPLPCVITGTNIVEMQLNSAACASCPPKGVWDLQILYPDGQIQTPIGGVVTVTADVTV